MKKYPVLFISHGSPMIAIEDDGYTAALSLLGKELMKPSAIVIVSAHWEAPVPVRVTSAAKHKLIYDFGGFPDELHTFQYLANGDPKLAKNIVQLLSDAGITAQADDNRGLDHGAWTPLSRIFPKADVPIVQVSLPYPRTPKSILEIGRALSPLRTSNILLMGSGGVVHNLRRLRFGQKDAPVDDWAKEFDDWVKSKLDTGDTPALLDYRIAPQAELAVQGPEHFDPIFFALGAAEHEKMRPVFEGFQYGNMSLRSIISA